MPPHKIWAEKGASSAMTATEKNSYRLTAVLTVRADGKKLPILFIIKGRDGGYLERNEIPSYPEGHLYAVQENAWMYNVTWKMYILELLRYLNYSV